MQPVNVVNRFKMPPAPAPAASNCTWSGLKKPPLEPPLSRSAVRNWNGSSSQLSLTMRTLISWLSYTILVLLLALHQVQAATLVYHQPTAVVYHHQPATGEEQQHPGYTIVAPLTKIAHVTYDSVPISHTPFEHVPLFQRIGHVKSVRI